MHVITTLCVCVKEASCARTDMETSPSSLYYASQRITPTLMKKNPETRSRLWTIVGNLAPALGTRVDSKAMWVTNGVLVTGQVV